jgi:hypothetical protein
MTTGNTTLLGLALPVEGELDGTWGDVVNDSITSLVDSAVAGTTTLSADADVTLTDTTLSANQARQAVLLWTASNGASTRNITAPARSKPYIVINAGTGSIVLRGAGPTTGVTIIAGEKCLAAWNGSDFVKVSSSVATALTGTLPVANGGTGATTLTSNNVILGNGTSAVQFVAPGTTGNVLTSTGTTWGSTALPAGGLTYIFTSTPVEATDKQGVLTDTSVASFTVTLPPTPSVGAQVVIADAGASWGTNNLTVARNGSTIGGLAEDLVCDITGASVQFVYDGTTWEVYAQIGGNGGSSQWTTSGSNIYYNTGNVGVGGTTAPANSVSVIAALGSDKGFSVDTNGLATAQFTSNPTSGEIKIGGVNGTAGNYFPAFYAAGAERARFNTTGALVFAGGTTTANGIGITFPATQSASSNANTLDDYEEGTWTPNFLADSGSATYTTQNGTYTKIGRQVTAVFYIQVNTSSSLVTSSIQGLPFVTSSASEFSGTALSNYDTGAYSGQCNVLGLVVPGSSRLQIRKTNSATAAPSLTATTITNGTVIAGTVTYFV